LKHITYNNTDTTPSKIICVGRNYTEHIEELGNEVPENMVLFNKPNSAITDTLHYFSPTCRFEGELCLLIENNQIAGLGLGLDLTHANTQNRLKEKGLPWERAKAFDNSAVLSSFINFTGNMSNLSFKLYLNDKLQQHANYNLMIYKPYEILKESQSFMTLENGDIIMTGTPKGVTPYIRGDIVSMELYNKKRIILSAQWRAN